MNSSNEESMVNFKPYQKIKKIPPKAYRILVGGKKDNTPRKDGKQELKKVNSDPKLISPRKLNFGSMFKCSENDDSNSRQLEFELLKQFQHEKEKVPSKQNVKERTKQHNPTFKKKDVLLGGKDEVSFRQTMQSGSTRRYFKDFCRGEMNAENIDFWEQVQYRFKKCKNKAQRIILAETLYRTYIEPGSMFALNINVKTANHIKDRIEKAKSGDESEILKDLFHPIQHEIETTMTDAYDRFKESDAYLSMLKWKKEQDSQIQDQIKVVKRGSCKF